MIMLRLALAGLWLHLGVTLAGAETINPATAAAVAKAAPLSLEEPRDIVAAIYRQAAIDVTKGKGSPFGNRETREKYFSKSFDERVTDAETRAAHDGRVLLAFDPISASRDAELRKVTLKTDLIEFGKAVVSAGFSNHGEPTVVTYDFVKEDGGWKIDDIKGTTEKGAWSVRKILSAPGKPQVPPAVNSAVDTKATGK